jgi:hypothetical protein
MRSDVLTFLPEDAPMLSKFDDYPIHQTPEPLAHHVSSDRNVYDRYWFNGYSDDGSFYFGIGAAIYPNLGIMDCGFSIVRDGVQHAFHGSRRAPREPSEIVVGPFRIDILEPMRRLRVVLADNETGMACDLTFEPRTANVQEGRQTLHRGARVLMDATRFDQFGRWKGEIRYAGQSLRIDPARVYGTKDRSWGVRPIGTQDPGGAPSYELPQIFFLWAPLQWKDRCSLVGVFEDAHGRMWHWDGVVVPAYGSADEIPGVEDPRTQHLLAVEHRLTYASGTRRAAAAEITMIEPGNVRSVVTLEPLLCFRMKGIGYTHAEWGHGMWKGELALAGESWRCDDLDPMALDNQHIQQVVRARCGNEKGIGVLEQICFGKHARYGFKEFLDPA